MAMAMAIQIRKKKERTKFIEKQVPFTAYLHPWQLKMEAASGIPKEAMLSSAAIGLYIIIMLLNSLFRVIHFEYYK